MRVLSNYEWQHACVAVRPVPLPFPPLRMSGCCSVDLAAAQLISSYCSPAASLCRGLSTAMVCAECAWTVEEVGYAPESPGRSRCSMLVGHPHAQCAATVHRPVLGQR